MKNSRPVVLIDQDDVLAEYIKGVTEAFNKKFYTSYMPEQCKSWNLCELFGEEIIQVMHEPELFINLEPVNDAIDVFKRLYYSEKIEMYIVTAAHPRTVEAKFAWIEKHLPFFPKKQVIVCSAKHMIKGDYLLDDGMHNIYDFAKAGGKPIVFERSHNREEIHKFPTVDGWIAFEKYLENELRKNTKIT